MVLFCYVLYDTSSLRLELYCIVLCVIGLQSTILDGIVLHCTAFRLASLNASAASFVWLV